MLSLFIYTWNQSIHVISTSIYIEIRKWFSCCYWLSDWGHTQSFLGLCTFFYYGLIVPLPNSYTETIFLNVMLLGDETIGRLIRIRWGHDFEALMNGTGALLRVTRELAFSLLSARWGCNENSAVCNLEEGSYQNLTSLQNCVNKFLLIIIHSV